MEINTVIFILWEKYFSSSKYSLTFFSFKIPQLFLSADHYANTK